MCQLLVGLGDVTVLGVVDGWINRPLEVHIETPDHGQTLCPTCGGHAVGKGRRKVRLVDLPSFGRQVRLVWHKRRWSCPAGCRSWSQEAGWIAAPRHRLTDRAGRWATFQVGRWGRTVAEVAVELGCDWHTVNTAVIAFGSVLVDHPDRIGTVTALGLDEVSFARVGRWRHKRWSTSIVDVAAGTLLDVVEGRDAAPACRWLAGRDPAWLAAIRWGTLDMSGAYRSVFDTMLPDAVQVADPFHYVRLANDKLDLTRRRVQNETLGHRGRKADPLYRARRQLTIAAERLDEDGHARLVGLLEAGDPDGAVGVAWQAKETVRTLYAIEDAEVAADWIDAMIVDFQRPGRPPEIRQLGRTTLKWRDQIVAWHQAKVTNGPTESMNNLCKRIKRVAFGMTNFRNWRIRVLLYAGRPDWNLLPTLTPLPA